MSVIVDIAGALASELKDHTFSKPLTIERAYRPVYELADLAAVRVTVVPKSVAITALSRTINQYDVAVDVAVQQKVFGSGNDVLDPLMGIVEEIGEFFRCRRLLAMPAAVWVKTENNPIYSPEHLETKRVFTSVLTLTFRVAR